MLPADSDKPHAIKEGTYTNETVEVKPVSTPMPEATGEAQPAFA